MEALRELYWPYIFVIYHKSSAKRSHIRFLWNLKNIRMKKTLLIIVATLMLTIVKAQEMQFSDSAYISILTCSPGQEVYAKFGHSGIRINDPVTKTDMVFNYGIFSFNTENFYYKFIKGETDYYLGVHPTDFFLAEYEERNSMVWEQVLDLSTTEKRKIIDTFCILYYFKP